MTNIILLTTSILTLTMNIVKLSAVSNFSFKRHYEYFKQMIIDKIYSVKTVTE